MLILGLTGSIGMGKTTAARNLLRLGVPVHDADAAVHALMAAGGGAVGPVSRAFPGVVAGGAVDRTRLGGIVFDDARALETLEAILHPMVRAAERHFLGVMARRGQPVVVLDVPLLFETGGEARCDAVINVSAPGFIQEARVLRRPGMTRERLDAILAKQMPDREKCRRADFVVQTGRGRWESLRALAKILKTVSTWRGRNWPPRRRPVSTKIGS